MLMFYTSPIAPFTQKYRFRSLHIGSLSLALQNGTYA